MGKKRIVLCILVTVMSGFIGATSAAAGQYDGLWQNDQTGIFFMIRSNGDDIVMVSFGSDGDGSELWVGVIKGNNFGLLSYNMDPELYISGSFLSDTEFSAIILFCSGSCMEGLAGTEFTVKKIF